MSLYEVQMLSDQSSEIRHILNKLFSTPFSISASLSQFASQVIFSTSVCKGVRKVQPKCNSDVARNDVSKLTPMTTNVTQQIVRIVAKVMNIDSQAVFAGVATGTAEAEDFAPSIQCDFHFVVVTG